MLFLNIINCRKESHMKEFIYILFIYNKGSTTGNIIVFEELNIIQRRIKKRDNPC